MRSKSMSLEIFLSNINYNPIARWIDEQIAVLHTDRTITRSDGMACKRRAQSNREANRSAMACRFTNLSVCWIENWQLSEESLFELFVAHGVEGARIDVYEGKDCCVVNL